MKRPVLLSLAALMMLGAPTLAQTASGTAGASAVNTRPVERAGAHAMLVDFTHGFMTVQAEYGANILTETFAAALQRSRDTLRPTGKPVPEEVKRGLIPFYPPELLDEVRYVIGDTSPSGVAGFAIRNGNAAAVTLIDTVVFKDESYVGSLALWAHELHHVQQYQEWGVSGFAARYAFGWRDVEAAAGERAKTFVAWYREKMGLK
ncbi:MAG: DUF4157 domain-containing protein [Alphaproteobacteria bacterium]|nr:MAG: DUF4157 domain-containing protein [Alphaproteobacteria bacterium]